MAKPTPRPEDTAKWGHRKPQDDSIRPALRLLSTVLKVEESPYPSLFPPPGTTTHFDRLRGLWVRADFSRKTSPGALGRRAEAKSRQGRGDGDSP